MKTLIILMVAIALPVASLHAQERIEMKGTSIIGNKELPKVLYIVPWKTAESIELTTPSYTSVLDDALAPLERPAFQRQVRYYHNLYPDVETQKNKP